MPESLEAWLARLEKRHHTTIDLGLDRCRKVWQNLGSPRPARFVFTVAGTNGKGSTVAYLDHVLRLCGKTCARYTSPHLLRFNERVFINGREAGSDELVQAFEEVEAHLDGISLTYFEFTTLAAFVLMSRARLDCAVLEVGLGGRLDAVNLIDPDCAVIMPIGLDHQEYLGDNVEQIGLEKAGIMRAGIPVVCGDRSPPRSLATRAAELGANFIQLGPDFEHRSVGETRLLSIGARNLAFPQAPLAGAHQADNFATSLTAIDTIFPGLLQVRPEWASGLESFHLPGRLTLVSDRPRVLVDVGHNPLAAEVVAQHFEASRVRRIHCVLAMLGDKDAGGVAQILAPRVLRWYCAGLQGARGRSGEALADTLRKEVPGIMAAPFERVADALDSAITQAGRADTVVVFGSFETAAQAIRHLGK